MAIDSNPRYTLDASGALADRLTDGAGECLIGLQEWFLGTRLDALVSDVAQRVIPGEESFEDGFRRLAFAGGGLVTCAAFMESDAPKALRHKALCQLSIGRMPVSILCETPAQALDAIEQVAVMGHASHPELRHVTDMVMEYYAEVTQTASMARLAFCGSGLMVHQLDRAWDLVHENIETSWRQETDGLDWDTLLGN